MKIKQNYKKCLPKMKNTENEIEIKNEKYKIKKNKNLDFKKINTLYLQINLHFI